MDSTLIRDVVVVIPGILGSELLDREQRPIWSVRGQALTRAIASFGRSVQALRLPAGIGDEAPDDGIKPGGLLDDLHVIPGLWRPVTGYSALLSFLAGRRFHLLAPDAREPGRMPNLIPFAYDWRLSNRYNGKRLARVASAALEHWRSQPGMEDARLILVCHSMGGLVARWFLSQEGGAELTRALITIGTPHRGSMQAVDTLVNGLDPKVGPLGLSLSEFARSLPSLHQLLPQYACLEGGPNGRMSLLDAGSPGLDSAMVADAVRFHEQIDSEPSRRYQLHKVVGIRQPTATTGRFVGGTVQVFETIDGVENGGDGTVPRLAAEPAAGRGSEVHEVADQHGELQAVRSTLDLIDGIITRQDIVWESAAAVGFGVAMADLQPCGESPQLRVVDGMGRRMTVKVFDERGAAVAPPVPVRPDGVAVLPILPPGGYRAQVSVSGRAGPPPVTHPFLVPEPGGWA